MNSPHLHWPAGGPLDKPHLFALPAAKQIKALMPENVML
ncbi:hypothetical protein CGLO_13181 [Colletotrichum gloeosporioides Cg-14]|uniref:Uncharacterized protein n=1 Tax=Colletotrichum gloeosporioides (strain Cg-14) TaxID=1237896 RepID=T0L7P1_COLGC|nr:hypothetical protein CGLO_13181 [Colletotrichum gloeosporioides Cg-14]